MPVGMRGVPRLSPLQRLQCDDAARARPWSRPSQGRAPRSASSTSVFHSPHDAHLPAQRGATAPQFWQTKDDRAGLAMRVSVSRAVDRRDARAGPSRVSSS